MAASTEARVNLPEITVSELSAALKRTVEEAFRLCAGARRNFGLSRPARSGHVYFSLKDEGARIEAVIWKGMFGRTALQARGRARSDRHRQAHHLPRQIQATRS